MAIAAAMGAIRRAMVDRLGTIPDVTVYRFVPDAINAPAMWVQPARPFVEYHHQAPGDTEWRFVVTTLVNRIDEESAQDALDEYLHPSGVLVRTLQYSDSDDALARLVNYVEVLSGQRYGVFSVGGTTYLGAEILVCVHA